MQKRILTEYRKLPKEVKKALKADYPFGFENVLTTIKMVSKGESASALLYNFNDTLYLIKYRVKKRIDQHLDETEEDEQFNNDEMDISNSSPPFKEGDTKKKLN